MLDLLDRVVKKLIVRKYNIMILNNHRIAILHLCKMWLILTNIHKICNWDIRYIIILYNSHKSAFELL